MGYGNTEIHLSPEQREALIQDYLGKTVDVVIDRPVGYHHVTKGIHLDYTINYGYLPGVIGGDGEEQDVYILGVEEPLASFTGRIIGAIRRSDDNEDKLVAAPEGMVFHQGQIAEATYFVEQYFSSKISAVFEKSCGVIPYREGADGVEFLVLLQRHSGMWSFPKGHMEAGESETDTALRELWEETNLTAEILPGFRTSLEYPVSEKARKEVVLFLGRVQGEPLVESREIVEYRWTDIQTATALLGQRYRKVMECVNDCFAQ